MQTVTRRGSTVMLLLAVLVTTGCRVDVVAEASLAADGTGTAGWSIAVDHTTAAAIADLGVEPFEGLASPAVAPWHVERADAADGTVVWRVWRSIDGADDMAHAFDELVAALAPDDPAIRVALAHSSAVRATTLDGSALFVAPTDVGLAIDGVPVGPDAEEFRTLVARSVNASVRMTVDGVVDAHNADEVDGTTLVWQLEPGVAREVTVTIARPVPVTMIAVAAGAVALALGALGFVVGGSRRRRRATTSGASAADQSPREGV